MVEEGDLGFAQVFVTNISSNNQQAIMPETEDSQVSFQQILPTLVQIDMIFWRENLSSMIRYDNFIVFEIIYDIGWDQ